MKRSLPNSIIEIWGDDYINNIEKRDANDKNAKIIAIERGTCHGDYIVEFVRSKKEDNKNE